MPTIVLLVSFARQRASDQMFPSWTIKGRLSMCVMWYIFGLADMFLTDSNPLRPSEFPEVRAQCPVQSNHRVDHRLHCTLRPPRRCRTHPTQSPNEAARRMPHYQQRRHTWQERDNAFGIFNLPASRWTSGSPKSGRQVSNCQLAIGISGFEFRIRGLAGKIVGGRRVPPGWLLRERGDLRCRAWGGRGASGSGRCWQSRP